jgi:hypothetical protein
VSNDLTRTSANEREHALPLAEAYAWVAAGDQRPLLILRECEHCRGTDHALLSRDLDNDQTILLSHWFRCVKLPPNVLVETHPFRHLFDAEKNGWVPHLFLSDADGSDRVPLSVGLSQAELWKTMLGFLERNYQGDARKAVKELRSLLAQFDRIDSLEQDLRARKNSEVEKHGPRSDRVKKYEADLADLQQERQALLQAEQQVRDLGMKDSSPASPPAAVASR